jgi:hypothetical protein
MPDTRITKDKLKNHFHYGKWIYILIAVVAWFAVDLVYTMTEYRPDRYHRVDVQLVGNSTMADEALDQVAKNAVAAVSPQDPKLEEVNIYNIAYSGDASSDVYGAQKYAVILAEGSSSIFFVDKALLTNMVNQGGAMPLEKYVESGVLPKDLSVTLPEADSDGNPTGVSHIYAIDASGLGGMLSDDIGFDVRDKYALIFGACVNPDTAAAVLRNLFDQLTGPAPDSAFAQSLAAATVAPASQTGDALAGTTVPDVQASPAPAGTTTPAQVTDAPDMTAAATAEPAASPAT